MKILLKKNAPRVVAGSDGSVHSKDKNGLAAWVVREEDQKYTTSCFLMQNLSSTTSYAAELERASSHPRTSNYAGWNPQKLSNSATT